jgi:hypothetical protein
VVEAKCVDAGLVKDRLADLRPGVTEVVPLFWHADQRTVAC